MYKHLKYQTADKLIILATRNDGSMVVVEPESGPLWGRVLSGEFGKVEAYVPPSKEYLYGVKAKAVREERDLKLSKEVDPIAGNILRWEDLSTEAKSSLSAYRLALLDVPQQDGFPNDVVWPTKPT